MTVSAFALRGVIAAVLTPFDDRGEPDAAKAIPYYRELLNAGCDGLNVMGTTGEGVSIALGARLKFMRAIAESGLPRDRLIVGTGATALGDAIELTRAAYDLGFAAALVIPPFYYRDASPEGIERFYGALVDRAVPTGGKLLLYNFPRMSGITFSPELVDRILQTCREAIAGIKDSSNDAELQTQLRERFPSLALFPGSESSLGALRSRGFAGCISGSVCLWPQLAQEVWKTGDESRSQELARLRAGLQGNSLIGAVRMHVALQQNDAGWRRSALPLQ
ncbi:MAG TPA: dihydrodipicolinate synthase family protein [Candidatus Baltobacteraceae bacterium]|jgi:4-hydroxy-tetrahydrodipicolinate synthase|nr:dihydrodipicolinate synthase family protein [Candidatus Baltobacteraceae bacterium]